MMCRAGKRFAIFYAVLFLFLISCDKEKEYDKAKAVSVFASIDPIRLDKSLENVEIKLPAQNDIQFWSGSASAQNQSSENIKKNFSLVRSGVFSGSGEELSLKKSSQTWFFYSGDVDDHFVFSPVIKDGKIFFLDTAGTLVARDLKTVKKIWKTQVFAKSFLKNYKTLKISYADGKIFAIGGVNKIAAIDAGAGKLLWSKEISAIPVSTPVSDGNFVYVSTNDNKLYAFDASSGELQWTQSGISRPTAIFGAADPVIYKDLIIVSYSSGEIYAVNKKTGEDIWSQDLNINSATNSDFYLNDIDATPVVNDDVVYTTGNGGLMMAVNVNNGNYLWKKEIAGIVDFWLSGEFLFLINNDNKLLAVSKKTGGIKWISQLPNLKKPKKPETKFIYSGIVMAGDRLLISRADGQLIIASPLDGSIEKIFEIGKKISHSPVVVDGKIYLYAIGSYIADLIEID